MTDTAQITKTLRDGRTAVITRTGLKLAVDLDGERYITDGHAGNVADTPFGRRHGVTRLIRETDRGVGLTRAEAESLGLIAAEDADRAARAATPEARRRSLVLDLHMAQHKRDGLRAQAADGDDGNWDYEPLRQVEEEITAAREALAAFDSGHPEVAAAEEADRRRSQKLADRLND